MWYSTSSNQAGWSSERFDKFEYVLIIILIIICLIVLIRDEKSTSWWMAERVAKSPKIGWIIT